MNQRELQRSRIAEICKSLGDIRKALYITQKDLVKEIGCSRASLCYWEEGRTQPTEESLEVWIGALAKEIVDLRKRNRGVRRLSRKERIEWGRKYHMEMEARDS
jgi:transcriptional regulator with XRE-family HTH domain